MNPKNQPPLQKSEWAQQQMQVKGVDLKDLEKVAADIMGVSVQEYRRLLTTITG